MFISGEKKIALGTPAARVASKSNYLGAAGIQKI